MNRQNFPPKSSPGRKKPAPPSWQVFYHRHLCYDHSSVHVIIGEQKNPPPPSLQVFYCRHLCYDHSSVHVVIGEQKNPPPPSWQVFYRRHLCYDRSNVHVTIGEQKNANPRWKLIVNRENVTEKQKRKRASPIYWQKFKLKTTYERVQKKNV